MLNFAPLGPEQIGQVAAEMSDLADHVTGDDRAGYEVWFPNDEVHVGFKDEEARDVFDAILDVEAAVEAGNADVRLPPVPTSPHPFTVR